MICYILLLFVFNNINIIKKWDIFYNNNNKYVLCILASNAKISKLMIMFILKNFTQYFLELLY